MKTSTLVLHVDDDPSILALVSRKLEMHGVKVVSVTDPNAVVKKLIDTGARVVLLDIDMPGKDGLTLLREIKQLDAGIQVIICTGMASIHTVLKATALGAEGCIFKPIVNLKEITDAVDRAFEKIERWWTTLYEWMERKKSKSDASDLESQLLKDVQLALGSDGTGPQFDAHTTLPSLQVETR